MSAQAEDPRLALLRARVRDIPDFPKQGILFRDLTPLMGDGAVFKQTVEMLAERLAPHRPEIVVAVESRGFIFGAPVAAALQIGFVPVRKPGKLPFRIASRSYALEYGTDTLEIHADAVVEGARVAIVDDLLATGGRRWRRSSSAASSAARLPSWRSPWSSACCGAASAWPGRKSSR